MPNPSAELAQPEDDSMMSGTDDNGGGGSSNSSAADTNPGVAMQKGGAGGADFGVNSACTAGLLSLHAALQVSENRRDFLSLSAWGEMVVWSVLP